MVLITVLIKESLDILGVSIYELYLRGNAVSCCVGSAAGILLGSEERTRISVNCRAVNR
jgi:hypothetical protein